MSPLLAVRPRFDEKACLDLFSPSTKVVVTGSILLRGGGRIVPEAAYCTAVIKRGLLSERVFISIVNGSEWGQVSIFFLVLYTATWNFNKKIFLKKQQKQKVKCLIHIFWLFSTLPWQVGTNGSLCGFSEF